MLDKTLEIDIKVRFLNHLRQKNLISRDLTIINEFVVDQSSRRVDMAIFNDKYSHAIEIKSEKDNLFRLNGQIESYLKYFDKITVIAARKHIKGVLADVPDNVEVWEVCEEKFRIIRRGRINVIKNKDNLLQLLRVNELFIFSKAIGCGKCPKIRRKLVEAVSIAPLKKIRNAVVCSLKGRYRISNELFWKMSENVITEESVRVLSLSEFKERKEERFKDHGLLLEAVTSIL